MIPHDLVERTGVAVQHRLGRTDIAKGRADAGLGEKESLLLVVVGESVAELDECAERCDIGLVLGVLRLQLCAELADTESAGITADRLEMRVAAVDHPVAGCCRDQLRLVLGRTPGFADHLDRRQIKEVPDEPLELGHDPQHERLVELLRPGLTRPASSRSRPGAPDQGVRTSKFVNVGTTSRVPIGEGRGASVLGHASNLHHPTAGERLQTDGPEKSTRSANARTVCASCSGVWPRCQAAATTSEATPSGCSTPGRKPSDL